MELFSYFTTFTHTHTHIHTHTYTHTHTHSTTHAYAQIDILAYFEICELNASGEYVPAAIHHSDSPETGGVFLLQQGVQRRLRVTLVYEAGSEIHWTRVKELVIGECGTSRLVRYPD